MTKPASSATIDSGVALFTAMTACWPLLEGSGTTSADKAGSRTLTFAGGGSAPTWSTDGAGDAIVSIATAQANPLALASSLTLGGGTSFSLAWRGKQSSDDNQGAVAGTSATTGFLTMFGGANYLGARSNASVDANFTINTFTADANYLLVYDQPAGYVHLYKDGTEVSGSPASVGSTFALTIDRLGNGYSGTTFALAGSLTYVYAWHGYAATSTDATNLHANPYHGLSASPTIAATPNRCEASRAITVTMAGHLTSWSSPTGLFTVSGGTGASISGIAVQSNTAATFTLQPGSALGTLTITDTSTSATTTIDVVDMFAGGIMSSSFLASSAVGGGGGAGGRTFIGAAGVQRVRQHGPITRVVANVDTIDGTLGWRFMVHRPNGSNWDFVSRSEAITPGGTGVQVFALSSPMACQPGDVVGVWLKGNNAIKVRAGTMSPAIKYVDNEQTGSNWASTSSLDDFTLELDFRAAFLTDVDTGDSRSAGHNGATSWLTVYEGTSGDLTAQPIHRLQYLLDNTRTTRNYQNFAKGSMGLAHVAGTQFPDIFNTYKLIPRNVWMQAPVNDIAAGMSNATMLAYLDTMYAMVPANTMFRPDECLPWTAGNNTQAAALRSWNTALAGWAVGKPNVKIVSCHDQMAQTRAGTGQLDDMAASFDYDGVHMTPAGVNKLGDLRFDSLIDHVSGGGGIASAEAFGTAVVTAFVVVALAAAGGISSAEAFGSPTVSAAYVMSVSGAGGIASAEAFGVPAVGGGAFGSISSAGDIASAEAFGSPTLTPTVPGPASVTAAGGIASAEAFGVPVVRQPGEGPNMPSPGYLLTEVIRAGKRCTEQGESPAFSSIDPEEEVTLGWDFGVLTTAGSNPEVTIELVAGEDDGDPADMLVDTPVIVSTQVLQRITGGVDTCRYAVRFEIDDDDGNKYVREGVLPVRAK